jgi:hypothetical protein
VTARCRGELGPKSFRGNRIYKGHKDIAPNKKASNRFEKASIPLKMYLKILNCSEKALKNN